VVYSEEYHNNDGLQLMVKAGIVLKYIDIKTITH